jgi:cytochrome c-type biogenesis protein CcmH/NrfG
MDDMVRILVFIVILGFFWYMLRYTRYEVWVFMLISIAVIPIFALVDSVVRARPLLTNPKWDLVMDSYLLAVAVIIIGYDVLRRYWPYPRMKTQQLWETAIVFYNENDNKQVWRTVRQVMAREPRWWGVRYMLGCICNQRGQYHRALWHLTFANELEPNQVEVLHELGYAYLMKKEYAKAKTILEQARQIDSDNQTVAGLLEECQREMNASGR